MTKEAIEDGAAMQGWVQSQIALAVAPLQKMLCEQQSASAKALDKIGRMKGRVDAIDPGAVGQALDALRKDAKELHARMQLQIFQMTVATEVSYPDVRSIEKLAYDLVEMGFADQAGESESRPAFRRCKIIENKKPEQKMSQPRIELISAVDVIKPMAAPQRPRLLSERLLDLAAEVASIESELVQCRSLSVSADELAALRDKAARFDNLQALLKA